MASSVFLAPVEGEDPCGPDLRWDPAFVQLLQSLDAAVAGDDDSVADAQRAGSDVPTLEEVAEMAQALGARTKDLRVLVIYAEARWRDRGLAAFADAMEELACVVETWPGPDDGVHPRADEEDGDLGERAAPLGRLLNSIPSLVSIVGWGKPVEISERAMVSGTLRGVFEAWESRLGPSFGPSLPSKGEAWRSLQSIAGPVVEVEGDGEGEAGETSPAAPGAPPVDVWDLIERAAESMTRQDRHSPALPILRLLASWRARGLIEIAESMKASGVSLEQLLDSIKKQIDQPPA